MTAGTYNITIEQGATFSRPMTYLDAARAPKDLTNYTARAKFRRGTHDGPVVIESEAPLSNLTLTLGGLAGTITLSMTAAQTGALTVTSGVWDLELETAGVVTRLLQGTFKVTPQATR